MKLTVRYSVLEEQWNLDRHDDDVFAFMWHVRLSFVFLEINVYFRNSDKLFTFTHSEAYYATPVMLKEASFQEIQVHGFSDASELAYVAVVYLRMINSSERAHVSLVTSKTKRLTIQCLELCGARLHTSLLYISKGWRTFGDFHTLKVTGHH